VKTGDLGEILIVQGTYFQDWLLYDTDWNWRVDAKAGGPSALHGRHWLALVRHGRACHRTPRDFLSVPICTTFPLHSQSSRSTRSETFSNYRSGPEDYVETAVDTEDFGAVIFRMGEQARGSVTASQVSAGRKNRLSIEICGTRASVAWNQERPDELWVGHRDSGNSNLREKILLTQTRGAQLR